VPAWAFLICNFNFLLQQDKDGRQRTTPDNLVPCLRCKINCMSRLNLWLETSDFSPSFLSLCLNYNPQYALCTRIVFFSIGQTMCWELELGTCCYLQQVGTTGWQTCFPGIKKIYIPQVLLPPRIFLPEQLASACTISPASVLCPLLFPGIFLPTLLGKNNLPPYPVFKIPLLKY